MNACHRHAVMLLPSKLDSAEELLSGDKRGHAGASGCGFHSPQKAGVAHGISYQVPFPSVMAVLCQLEMLLTRNEAVMKAAGIWIVNRRHFVLLFFESGCWLANLSIWQFYLHTPLLNCADFKN